MKTDPEKTDVPVPAAPTVEETVQRALEAQRAELEAAHLKALDDQAQQLAAAKRSLEAKDRELGELGQLAAKLNAGKAPTDPAPAARIAQSETSLSKGTPFITRQTLIDARACQLRTFDARVKELGDVEGFHWTEDEVRRTYALGPHVLRFYEARGLVPMLEVDGVPSVRERKKQIAEIGKRQIKDRNKVLGALGFSRG